MVCVFFGQRNKRVYRTKSQYTENTYDQKIEISTESCLRIDNNQQLTSSTARLIYNMGIDVSNELWFSYLPEFNDDFSIINQSLAELKNLGISDFNLGKSMLGWRDQNPGYAPCISLTGAHKKTDNNRILFAIRDQLSFIDISIDNKIFRCIERGFGYYIGKKGEERWNDRAQNNPFQIDPTLGVQGEIDRKIKQGSWDDNINLVIDFTLAEVSVDRKNATTHIQNFFYGDYPALSVSLNVHLKKSNKPYRCRNSASVIGLIERELSQGFKPFILKNFSVIRNLSDPEKCHPEYDGWQAPEEFTDTPVHPNYEYRDLETIHCEITFSISNKNNPKPLKEKIEKPSSYGMFSGFNNETESDSDENSIGSNP